jgi:hypothetical protein
MMSLPDRDPEERKCGSQIRYLVFGDPPSRDNELYSDAFIKARLQLVSSHAAHGTVTV